MWEMTSSSDLYGRDDWLTQAWVAGSGVTATTDGDILSLSGTGSDNAHGIVNASFTPFSSTTYPIVIIRAKGSGTIVFQEQGGPQNFTLTLNSSNYTTFVNTWAPGKTIVT